ncbi:hypothetical protein [Pontibacter sp. G13]|uniref:toxin-antitoxin system YwqK family antitoxin n=1 Tax=Pontibacter sp. G13 TaxID=3074898 RepID=UPI00288AC926|nr:hypothetical protein [Pontibacter sp. G13]WNJ18811.1 hypothetical protein RJD25_28475 [Pontibacter sp. G13]
MRLIIIAIMALIANWYPKGVLSQGFHEQFFDSIAVRRWGIDQSGNPQTTAIKIYSYPESDSNRSQIYSISSTDNATEFGASWNVYGNPSMRFIEFWDNGLIRCCVQFQNGEKYGVWVFYSEDGELIRKEDYTSGKMVCDPCNSLDNMVIFGISP